MSEHNNDIPLPEQQEGAEKNIETIVEAETPEQAKQLYNESRQRLLTVNKWHDICGQLSAKFQLTDEKGTPVEGAPKQGYHFKIDIPGPGSASGEGFDWVRVEEVTENTEESTDCEFTLVRVRPTDNPTTDDDNVAHFFSDKATSNFVVKREGTKVIAAVYGRNEVPNTHTDKIIDKTRNAVVGVTALAGASNPQWKALANAVVGK